MIPASQYSALFALCCAREQCKHPVRWNVTDRKQVSMPITFHYWKKEKLIYICLNNGRRNWYYTSKLCTLQLMYIVFTVITYRNKQLLCIVIMSKYCCNSKSYSSTYLTQQLLHRPTNFTFTLFQCTEGRPNVLLIIFRLHYLKLV